MVLLGTFFDLFDGLFARLLKAESQFGLQFDSMADLITSGIVPGVVMYKSKKVPSSNALNLN